MELIERILAETDASIAVTVVKPHPALEQIAARSPERIQFFRDLPLEELVALIARGRALVTVDAGRNISPTR